MQHPTSRDSDNASKGAQANDEADDWPAYAASEPWRPDFDAAPAIVSAAIEKARAHAAAPQAISTAAQPRDHIPQPMSDQGAKYPGFYPAFAIRSALFSCARTGADDQIRQRSIKIAGRQGETVTLETAGPLLTMADKDVWEIALDIERERRAPYGKPFEASLGEFAERMGRKSMGGAVKQKIRRSVDRLAACSVGLVDGSAMASGRMISRVDDSGHALRIELDPGLIEPALVRTKLFMIDAGRRRGLRSSLAKWMHDFMSTHGVKHAIDLAYLREMCGYGGSAAEFPAALCLAVQEIQSLGADEETRPLAKSYSIDKPTASSGEWMLHWEIGAQKPAYRMPPASRAAKANL